MVYFSKEETRDLIIAIAVITILFAYVQSDKVLGSILVLLPISLFSIGLSFILHELGHKVVAQRYGFFAEFRRWDQGLIIAVITGLLFNVIFLAPGAVYIGSITGMISDEENGKISLAGPVVNIILALIFLALMIITQPIITNDLIYYLYIIEHVGFNINSFLAFFNLLPIPMFDGSKILKWNVIIWLFTMIIAVGLTFMSYTI